MILTEPDEILVNFLRARVSELTRTGYAARQELQQDTFDGDAAEDTFTMTENVVSIISVVVGGVTQIPYYHYDIDWDNKQIIFRADYIPGSGTDNIVVNYYSGTSWVFPDKPRDDLKKSSYPRIGVIQITEPHEFVGVGTVETWARSVFQIDIVTFKDLLCTISTETKEGEDVVRYLSREVIKALKTYFLTDLSPKFTDFSIIDNHSIPYGQDSNIFHRVIELSLLIRNTGE